MRPARGWAEWWLGLTNLANDRLWLDSLASTIKRIQAEARAEALEEAARVIESDLDITKPEFKTRVRATAAAIRALKETP